jgi:hypothetical protein
VVVVLVLLGVVEMEEKVKWTCSRSGSDYYLLYKTLCRNKSILLLRYTEREHIHHIPMQKKSLPIPSVPARNCENHTSHRGFDQK